MLCVAVSFFTISLGRTQGTLDAVTIGSGFQPAGYVNGGVGWTFVPTVDIGVTAVGHSEAGPYETRFWAGTNVPIASYTTVNDSPYDFQFHSISPLYLSAGQTYSITLQQTNLASSLVPLHFYLSSGGETAPFSLSSYLTEFASYEITQDGAWHLQPKALNGADFLLLGPNFRFEVVPEPEVFELLFLGIIAWVIPRGVTLIQYRKISNPSGPSN